MKITKKTQQHLKMVRAALDDLEKGLNGQPFTWGSSEASSKGSILLSLGYTVVSKTKLERGGHELKERVQPIGRIYYTSPISKYNDVYLLELQARRSLKWYDRYGKGKALLEATHQFTRKEFA